MVAKKIYKVNNLAKIKIKHNGKVYTPNYLVDVILNGCHYISGNINKNM